MRKTTVYLPDELKAKLAAASRREERSEAEIIRDAIEAAVSRHAAPRPKVPLTNRGLGDSRAAERVDHLLDGFGR